MFLARGYIFKSGVLLNTKDENYSDIRICEENNDNDFAIWCSVETSSPKKYFSDESDWEFIIQSEYFCPSWFNNNKEKYKRMFFEETRKYLSTFCFQDKVIDEIKSEDESDLYCFKNCTINKISGQTQIKLICGNSIVKQIQDKVYIKEIQDNVLIEKVKHISYIEKVEKGCTIMNMEDASRIYHLFGTVKNITGSANVYNIHSSGTILNRG